MLRKLTLALLGASMFLLFGFGFAFGYNEAPMLADQVKAGKLQPVDERLPEKPFVPTLRQSANTEERSGLEIFYRAFPSICNRGLGLSD